MSWTGENKEGIGRAKLLLQVRRTPETLVSAASAYYSGAGTSFKQFKEQPWKLHLLLRAWRWSRSALKLTNEAHATAIVDNKWSKVSYSLTMDQIDVMCTIWHRFGTTQQQHWGTELLTYAALNLDPRVTVQHTLAFIALHRVRYGLDEWSDDVHDRVLRSAQQVAKEARASQSKLALLGQASRIMRQLAEMLPESDERRVQHFDLSALYAKEGGATDQLLKLGK